MEPIYSSEELAQLADYLAPTYFIAAVNLVTWPLVLALFAFTFWRLYPRLPLGAAQGPAGRLWGDGTWLPTLLFALAYFFSLVLLYLPVEVWLGYVRERQYGMVHQSPGSFLWDAAKSLSLYAASIAALALGVFGVARRTKHWWWLVALASSLVFVASAALEPYGSQLYVEHSPLPAGPLRERLTGLLRRAEVPFSELRVVHTSVNSVRVQAAFGGSGPTRTILLTDTLLASMTDDEVAAAVAHEIGHVRESRGPGRVLSVLALFVLLGFWEWLFRAAARRRWFGVRTRGDVRVLPLLMLVFNLVMRVSGPVAEAVSRQRELEADRIAVELTGDPATLSSLLRKLTRLNRTDPDPPRWYVLLLSSHPPMNERLAAIAPR